MNGNVANVQWLPTITHPPPLKCGDDTSDDTPDDNDGYSHLYQVDCSNKKNIPWIGH